MNKWTWKDENGEFVTVLSNEKPEGAKKAWWVRCAQLEVVTTALEEPYELGKEHGGISG